MNKRFAAPSKHTMQVYLRARWPIRPVVCNLWPCHALIATLASSDIKNAQFEILLIHFSAVPNGQQIRFTLRRKLEIRPNFLFSVIRSFFFFSWPRLFTPAFRAQSLRRGRQQVTCLSQTRCPSRWSSVGPSGRLPCWWSGCSQRPLRPPPRPRLVRACRHFPDGRCRGSDRI